MARQRSSICSDIPSSFSHSEFLSSTISSLGSSFKLSGDIPIILDLDCDPYVETSPEFTNSGKLSTDSSGTVGTFGDIPQRLDESHGSQSMSSIETILCIPGDDSHRNLTTTMTSGSDESDRNGRSDLVDGLPITDSSFTLPAYLAPESVHGDFRPVSGSAISTGAVEPACFPSLQSPRFRGDLGRIHSRAHISQGQNTAATQSDTTVSIAGQVHDMICATSVEEIAESDGESNATFLSESTPQESPPQIDCRLYPPHHHSSTQSTQGIGLLDCDDGGQADFLRLSPSQSYGNLIANLRETTVELCIDQEGFRAIRPQFRLAGFSNPGQMHTGDAGGDTAEFIPVRRQSYSFHYATLDREPALRRITVNDDESRDYLSRQACLTVKANGVYSVCGTEELKTACGNDRSKAVLLKWKLEYLVEDRKTETTRKVIHGEKALTPLAFTCCPRLLARSQGVKITIMHVMRKSITAKLVAVRMEPPMVHAAGAHPDKKLHTPLSALESSSMNEPHEPQPHDVVVLNGLQKIMASVSRPNTPPFTLVRPSRGRNKENDLHDKSCHVHTMQTSHIISPTHKFAEQMFLSSLQPATTHREFTTANLVRPIIPRTELLKMFPSAGDLRDHLNNANQLSSTTFSEGLRPPPQPRR